MCSLLAFLLQRVNNAFSPAHFGERRASRSDITASTIGHSRSAVTATGYDGIDPELSVNTASLRDDVNLTSQQEVAGITKDKKSSRGPPRVKNITLSKQREQLILDEIDVTTRKNVERKEESRKKLEKISAIQEIAQKLEVTRSTMSDQLVQQSDRLSDMMTSLANEKQAMQQVLADKENFKIVDKLQADNDDAKEINQQKPEWFSDEQKLEEEIFYLKNQIRVKEEMMRVKDNVLVKFKQDLKEYWKITYEQSLKISTLQKQVAEKEEDLSVARKEISDLNDQIAKQFDLLSAEMADKQKAQNILANKKKINWRIVDKFEADSEMYM